ncbi:MAG: hypothetical protein QXE01_11610 [Sulfolobales archaeon]
MAGYVAILFGRSRRSDYIDFIARGVDEERFLEDIIHQAMWNAEIVRKISVKWFEIRDRWLQEAFERDREMWKDTKIREALIKAILAKDRNSKILSFPSNPKGSYQDLPE